MFSVTLVHFHVLSVGTVMDCRTQSSTHSASSGCKRGAAVSRAEFLQTQTMFAQGVMNKPKVIQNNLKFRNKIIQHFEWTGLSTCML